MMLKLFKLPKLWLMAGVVSAMLIGATALYFVGKRDGTAQATTKSALETVERIDAGAKAATQARTLQREGRTPEDGVRSRDGAWE